MSMQEGGGGSVGTWCRDGGAGSQARRRDHLGGAAGVVAYRCHSKKEDEGLWAGLQCHLKLAGWQVTGRPEKLQKSK